MAKSKTSRKRTPKHVLKLPDLEQSKSAVLNSLTSQSSQRTYDHAIREFIEWYCSEPRLAFNKTVVIGHIKTDEGQLHLVSHRIRKDRYQDIERSYEESNERLSAMLRRFLNRLNQQLDLLVRRQHC